MATFTSSVPASRVIGQGPWTSHDLYELFLWLVQSCGIVCAGVFLCYLGPILCAAVLAGSLMAWSKARNHLAAANAACLADEDGEHDGPASSVSVP